MRQPLNILVVEDSAEDLVFIIRELQRGGYEPVYQRVETAEDFMAALAVGGWEAVIADYSLPQFSAMEALELLQASGIDLPFLIVSGAIGEEMAVEAMKSGAHDFIVKSSLPRLVPAVERELREARDRQRRREAETHMVAFSKLGQSLASASTRMDAARVIGNIANELLGMDAFTLDLYFSETGQIETVLNVDTFQGVKQDVASTVKEGTPSVLARRIIDSGAELILREELTAMLPEGAPIGDLARPSASLMFVPIRIRAQVIGIMSVQSYAPKAYDARSLRTLQTLADYCGGTLERIRAQEELQTSREQLRALAAHLQSVREEERKLITREIHDELGQSLTGFKMDLAWMRNRMQAEEWGTIRQPILDKIKTMGKLIDGTANLMRKLCTELRPGVLDDLGLTAAIEWQAREYQERTGIVCAVKVDLGELTVDPERSTALFRIFQEILTNVARHAKATRVEAVMQATGAEVWLEVKDNGRGIKPSEIAGAKSLGLLGMRERAFILGGAVVIRGAAGKGTTVRVTVPLPEFNLEPG